MSVDLNVTAVFLSNTNSINLSKVSLSLAFTSEMIMKMSGFLFKFLKCTSQIETGLIKKDCLSNSKQFLPKTIQVVSDFLTFKARLHNVEKIPSVQSLVATSNRPNICGAVIA